MQRRAQHVGDCQHRPAKLAVNFDIDGNNEHGARQFPCERCGDCVTGCNFGAKNTLDKNYLRVAKNHKTLMFTQIEVRRIEKRRDGKFLVHYRRNSKKSVGRVRTLVAHNVILSAGAIGSTEILLRSARFGLPVSHLLGQRFSGNGDLIALGYNTDHRINSLGFGVGQLGGPRSQVRSGPNIISVIQYGRSKSFNQRFTVEDISLLASGAVDLLRRSLPKLAMFSGTDTDAGVIDTWHEFRRIMLNIAKWSPDGAANHTIGYLGMAIDTPGGVSSSKGGRVHLNKDDRIDVRWPDLKKLKFFKPVEREFQKHTEALGGTYAPASEWNPFTDDRTFLTAHPLAGCGLGDDASSGVVDANGRVFDGEGDVHNGLYVVNGAVAPMAFAVNPLLAISALAERTATAMPKSLVMRP